MNNLKAFFPYVQKYRREFLLGIFSLIVADCMTLVVPLLIKEFIDILPQKPAIELLLKFVLYLFMISYFLKPESLGVCDKNYSFNCEKSSGI